MRILLGVIGFCAILMLGIKGLTMLWNFLFKK
jgi:hypothetical protein